MLNYAIQLVVVRYHTRPDKIDFVAAHVRALSASLAPRAP